MSKVLVTGGTGFIGSHLAELLVSQNYEVKVFDRYNPENHWGWLENSEKKNDIEVILGDIRDFDSVLKSTESVDCVLHLAALIGIPYSYISPLAYIKTNVEGTYNILEASKINQVPNIVITSTSEVYGTAQYTPIDEEHPKVGQSPYSASKIAADQIALSYSKSFNLPIKIIRPFNTFGPRQSLRAIIPTIISQALSGITKISLGTTSTTRDFTFVSDTCNGFIEVMKSDRLFGKEVNLGMNEEISVENLVKLIGKLAKIDLTIEEDKQRIRPKGSEVERLRCNNEKIIKSTKWKPKFTLEKGLKRTIEWFSDKNTNSFKTDKYLV